MSKVILRVLVSLLGQSAALDYVIHAVVGQIDLLAHLYGLYCQVDLEGFQALWLLSYAVSVFFGWVSISPL